MRLIDYDALEQYAVEYQERHKGNELTRGEFKLIDNFMFECPKTEAIPVEWVFEQMQILHELHNKNEYVLQWLMELWQKEQEDA